VPSGLVTDAFRLEPLGPQHNEDDYRAWQSSVDHIRSTPGFVGRSWPRPEMTLEDNLGDLNRHADDFSRRTGFTYTVLDNAGGEVVGCVYIYPAKSDDSAAARVSSWVRADRAGLDRELHAAVSDWLATAWPFPAVDYAPR
jgi:hypothetical protein